MDRFKIFPSIGVARLGGSKSSFFICPESEYSLGVELDIAGVEKEIEYFKDGQGLIKRQGARFRVFELDPDSNEYKPADMTKLTVEWTAHLVNKKAAVVRPANPPGIP